MPANIELTLLPAGPGFPPIALGGGLTSYALYILAGLREAHPEIDLNSYLNDLGREKVDSAEKLCAADLDEASKDLVLGDIFSRPLSQIPNFQGLLNDYMGCTDQWIRSPHLHRPGPCLTWMSLHRLHFRWLQRWSPTVNRSRSRPTTPITAALVVESQADTIPFVANLFR